MKKILFVLPGFSYGGSTTALLSILNSKLTKKYDIDVFSIVKGDNLAPVLSRFNIGKNEWTNAFYSDFCTLSLQEKIKAFFLKILRQTCFNTRIEAWVVKKTINKIERKKYDCIVAFQEKQATDFCQYFSVEHKIAWIHCDYGKAYPREESDLQLYGKYNKIVCVSKATRDSFLSYYPSLSERTIFIYNLFDSNSIITKSLEKIEDPNFDCDPFTIISVGRINKVKRFELIPGIAKKLFERGLDFKWYIIGQPYSKEELKKLNNAIAENEVGDFVIYLGGKSNPYPYFLAANLLVSVSSSEACPMIFNEAKLLNLKIVSTDFPSAYEFIDENNDGKITSIEKMTDTISEMISYQHGLSKVETRFDAEALNEKILLQLSQLF